MKRIILAVISGLSIFLLQILPSDCSESNTKQILIAQLDYNNLKKQSNHEKKSVHLNTTDYNYILGEKFVLREEKKEERIVVQKKGSGNYFQLYMHNYELNQPLIYRNSVDFPYEKITRPFKSSKLDLEFSSLLSEVEHGEILPIGAAFLTTLAIHEFGHVVAADYIGTTRASIDLFKKQDGKFFLGMSTVKQIDNGSRLSYNMAGPVADDLTFEHALQNYRKKPTAFNKSLLFLSGTDFLTYCLYSFYLTDGHPYFDPIAISETTGISKDIIFSVALAKTMINAYRVYSGNDWIVPYFTIDKHSAMLNLSIAF